MLASESEDSAAQDGEPGVVGIVAGIVKTRENEEKYLSAFVCERSSL